MEFDKTLPRNILMLKIFKLVQAIPFKIIPFDSKEYACRETVTANLEEGDSRHKSKVLYNLLMQCNFEAEKIKVIFDWKDLPIPKEILNILQKSTTKQAHDILEVKLSDHCKSYIDPTWSPELKELGFPITEEWDGKESTKQVTTGKLEYVNAEDFNPKEHQIKTDEEEYDRFSQALNSWIKESI